MLTLYEYHLCPHCIKIRMLLNLKAISYQSVNVDYADIETPTNMIGKKMLPILAIPNKNETRYMAESFDILDYLDNHYGTPIITPSSQQIKLEEIFSEYFKPTYSLLMPRYIKAQLEEISTPAAEKYAREKYESMLGDTFENLFKRSPEFLAQMPHLMTAISAFLNESNQIEKSLSYADFSLLPRLINLTIVKEMPFTEPLKKYLHFWCKKMQLNHYMDIAL